MKSVIIVNIPSVILCILSYKEVFYNLYEHASFNVTHEENGEIRIDAKILSFFQYLPVVDVDVDG